MLILCTVEIALAYDYFSIFPVFTTRRRRRRHHIASSGRRVAPGPVGWPVSRGWQEQIGYLQLRT